MSLPIIGAVTYLKKRKNDGKTMIFVCKIFAQRSNKTKTLPYQSHRHNCYNGLKLKCLPCNIETLDRFDGTGDATFSMVFPVFSLTFIW